MKRIILLSTFIIQSTLSFCQTQAIRDSIIGKYFCNVTFTGNGQTSYHTDTIYPYPVPLDSLAFIIDDGKFCCWTAHMVLNNNSVFIATNALSQGVFYAPDSLYYFHNCLSPLGCYYNFYCLKISSSIGLQEIKGLTGIQINPNPVSENFNLTFNKHYNLLNATLYNITGQKVFEKQFINPGTMFEINVSTYPRGIYLLKLSDELASKSFKVVLQ